MDKKVEKAELSDVELAIAAGGWWDTLWKKIRSTETKTRVPFHGKFG